MTAAHTLTQLLKDWNAGDQAALAQLAPCVDSELRRLAGAYMRQQQPDHILQTTALVNEAWVHLIEWREVSWQNRAHFFGLAAQVMRNILVDEARRCRAQKHGGAHLRVSLSDAANETIRNDPDLVALDDALNTLARFDERRSRIVELRFFVGLSVAETAEVLQVSPRTVAREWQLAQAWLYQELSSAYPEEGLNDEQP
ncbi:MAG: sigma-70 family RNA polymerase sigma factor [Acidobacteria bacterium]|nr:sigma-70 family RNA polymerase sigma factor [Acidobacteriota bacterium]MBI3423415.1 sigma-70 family RNA polymerase sigma factor [Acidobacteriota bacterium]